jgi:hypothetical protein
MQISIAISIESFSNIRRTLESLFIKSKEVRYLGSSINNSFSASQIKEKNLNVVGNANNIGINSYLTKILQTMRLKIET